MGLGSFLQGKVAWVWPDIGSAGAKMGFLKKELLMLLLMGGG